MRQMIEIQKGYPARWWNTLEDGRILCTLCPRFCKIPLGKSGFCYIRENEGGNLITTGYGKPSGFGIDPIEKKPLNHFFPGSKILSFGTVGCNLGCRFCQNWSISKTREKEGSSPFFTPEDIVQLAKQKECQSIAFTYNDPTIFGEYVIDVAQEARKKGLNSVMVTAGYITPEPREEIYQFIDAVNVDLKAFSTEFYRKWTISHLEPVLETLKWLVHHSSCWVEVTTLLIPGLNDSEEELHSMTEWFVESLGTEVPLHFSAFHPDFKMKDRPRTPLSTLIKARNIAKGGGIKHVYLGNVHDPLGQSTYCGNCNTSLIERDWHSILHNRLILNSCPKCKTILSGHF